MGQSGLLTILKIFNSKLDKKLTIKIYVFSVKSSITNRPRKLFCISLLSPLAMRHNREYFSVQFLKQTKILTVSARDRQQSPRSPESDCCLLTICPAELNSLSSCNVSLVI